MPGPSLERGWMMYRCRPGKLVCAGVVCVLAMVCGCSPDFHKADADKEVYNIIDGKWRDSFGQKANYIVGDSNLSTPNDIRVEVIPTAPEMMTLVQAVAIATANSRTYQTRKEDLYLSALSLTGVRHDYEAQLFATIDGTYSSREISPQDRNDDFRLHSNLGVQQDILLGDRIQVGTNLAVDWAKFLTGDPRFTLGSILHTTATATLLGAGGREGPRQKRETLIQAEREVLYDIRTFNRYRQEFVVNTITAYYRVLQQRDTVTNAQNNYKRVLESQDRLQMEAEAGRRTRIDVDEAQQNVLRAEASVVTTQQSYERALDDFKIRLAVPTDANVELDQNELIALREMGITEAAFGVNEAIETALLRRLDLANSADSIDDSLRKVILAADGLGTQLDVSTSIDYSSPRNETDFQSLRFHQGTYNLGFDADLPFDRKIQRNNYRTALINLERQERQYEGDVDNVKLQVRDAYRVLKETAERYRIQQNSLQLATQRVESNKLLLDAGRVTVRILLESQDALVQAENAVTAALVEHLNAKLSFYRDVGILQVKPDGMWAQSDTISEERTNDNGQDKPSSEENI